MSSLFIVRKMIDDKILSVLIGVIDFFGMMLRNIRPGVVGPASKNVRYVLSKLA